MDHTQIEEIKEFIIRGVEKEKVNQNYDPTWKQLSDTGSELWLDTGDFEVAERIWSSEMKALTTNNSLINNEIQKGIYDDFIASAKKIVRFLPYNEQVMEIAFMLNARHGLRLAKKFGVYVSVELHTATAHDIDAIVHYGKRYHEICPNQFIIKVPYTASGLIGARKLREAGIRINFTLEFSTRQNVMVATITKPDYLNIFMGRIGSYFYDNNLGSGKGAGEKTVLSTQKWVNEISKSNTVKTSLIIASLTAIIQIKSIAGIDCFTVPPNLIIEGRQKMVTGFSSKLDEDYNVDLNKEAYRYFPNKLWDVAQKELELARYLDQNCPASAKELIKIAYEAGCRDMFPKLSESELNTINKDGKIPDHKRWASKIEQEEIAIDTLLNIAGLNIFKNAQDELDARIKKIID